jgi:glycosyltransferase involved in cell wall biosynthesis
VRVLHIISSGGMYGAEAVILNLSHTLNAGGHHSVLGVFSNDANANIELHAAATSQGIESHLIPCSGQMDRTVGTKIRALIATTHADVVHAHGYKADIYCYFALRCQRVARVSTCHTWYDNDWKVTLYGKIDRFVLRSFDGVVAVSDEVKRELLQAGVAAEKVSLIRNGIDLTPFAGADPTFRDELEPGHPERMIVGLVGRLSKEKGVDVFVRAAALVVQQMPETRFVVIGDGEDRELLEALIDELGVRFSVRLVGPRSGMASIYASLDVMVSASRKEGLPIAILEGLASARPLIATPVGAVASVVRDGETGILIAPGDHVLLAATIMRLLEDAELRRKLGEAGRKVIAEEFSAMRMTAEYLQVYAAAIATRGQA